MAVRVALALCFLVGTCVAYSARREAPYFVGPNDPYAVEVNSNFLQEPSQRLFWDKFGNNGSGSNQVGGTGIWAMMTNKFPWLNNMFGRMEVAPLSGQYGAPPQQYYQEQGYNYLPQGYHQQQGYNYQSYNRLPQVYNQQPQVYSQQPQDYNQKPQVYNQQPQVYNQQPQVYNQQPQAYNQQPQIYNQQAQVNSQQPQAPFFPRNIPSRNVGLTDDAVIVTPPHVPVFPSAPVPVFPSAPAPIPAPEPSPQGYQYNKPQYKLELPHK